MTTPSSSSSSSSSHDPTSPPSLAPPTTTTPMPGISLGLRRITHLLHALQSPHLSTPIIHIAGTNGKGSVSAYLSSILSSANPPLRVGRFNSPHLVDEWDCIRLPRSPSSGGTTRGGGEDPFLSPVPSHLFRSTKHEIEHLSLSLGINATSFEILTATAYTLFARASPPLDLAVVEVGMGGAEDATNIVPAEKTLLSVVTPVELDHQKFLGDTVGEIAAVKGGIIREGGDVVLARQAHPEAVEAVKRIARERGARVWEAGVGELVPSSFPPVPPASLSTSSSSASTSAPTSGDSTPALPPPPLVSLPLLPLSTTPPLPPSHPLFSNPTSSSPFLPTPSSSITTPLPLPGSYQLSNSAVASLSAHLLRSLPRIVALVPALGERGRVSDQAIREGVRRTKWEGRLTWTTLPSPLPLPSPTVSVVSPAPPRPRRRLLLDGAHNPSSASLLSSYILSLPPPLRPSTLIFALSAPRAPGTVLPPLLVKEAGVTRVVCVGFGRVEGMEWVRPVPPGELAEGVREVVRQEGRVGQGEGGVQVFEAEDVEGALRLLDSLDLDQDLGAEGKGEGQGEKGERPTLVAGSLYLVADVVRVQRRLEEKGEEGEGKVEG